MLLQYCKYVQPDNKNFDYYNILYSLDFGSLEIKSIVIIYICREYTLLQYQQKSKIEYYNQTLCVLY